MTMRRTPKSIKNDHTEFEILRLNNTDNNSDDYHFLIKKVFSYKYFALGENIFDQEETLKIYYADLSYRDIRFQNPPWSIKWESSGLFKNTPETRVIHTVKYADGGPFQVKKEYQNIGLGSYLIDSLTLWAKERCCDFYVDIHIIGPDYTADPPEKINHFYSKRNLEQGMKVSEIKTFFFDSGKGEILPIDNFVPEIFYERNNLQRKLGRAREFNHELLHKIFGLTRINNLFMVASISLFIIGLYYLFQLA